MNINLNDQPLTTVHEMVEYFDGGILEEFFDIQELFTEEAQTWSIFMVAQLAEGYLAKHGTCSEPVDAALNLGTMGLMGEVFATHGDINAPEGTSSWLEVIASLNAPAED